MNRRSRAVMAWTLAAICLAPIGAAAEALLRDHVLVDSDYVTLGDLFDNAGPRAAAQILKAPAAGQRITVDNDWLQHVALVNGLTWHSNDLFASAVIERAAAVIGRDRIIAGLQEALLQQGATFEFLIEIDGRDPQMTVPVGTTPNLVVRDLFYDRDGNRFTAMLAVPGEQGDLARLPVAGHLVQTDHVPVLNRGVARGETITASDIAWIKVRHSEIRPATVTDVDLIVGQAAKLQLRSGLPLSSTDLQKPLAVTRGATVVMVLAQGGMALSAQGRAIDQGSLGDVIRVTNSHSNLTVEGTVDGTNHVRVSLGSPVALANE